ncbi:MAG: YdbL family protein [Pseudomonadales bacterium]
MLMLLGTGTAWALSLNEAMSALPTAKEAGQLGEQPSGYLGVVKAGGNATDVAQQINAARKEEYQRVAKSNGIALKDVEAIAGQKAIDRTPAGQYIQINGSWVRK